VSTVKTVAFYFDFGSPASYLAATQLPRIARETGATIDWRPTLLGGVFKATGNRSPAEVPAKAGYMMRDLARFAARYGVPFRFNPNFPLNTLQLMRIAIAAQHKAPANFERFVSHVFRAMWVDEQNLGDATALAEALTTGGFDAAALVAASLEPAVKDALKANTEGAIERGVFGVPTIFVGDEMFFGQDRLDFVREALERTA
jgi:2-hydroxychromene-2-carboxylate isomerase